MRYGRLKRDRDIQDLLWKLADDVSHLKQNNIDDSQQNFGGIGTCLRSDGPLSSSSNHDNNTYSI